MDKLYRVNVTWPSGLKKVVTVRPGNTRIVAERAIGENGALLHSVTVDDHGVCIETGQMLRLKRILCPLLLNMERVIFYVGVTQKNKLGIGAAEWPCEVTPVDEFYPEMLMQQATDETFSDDERAAMAARLGVTSVVQELHGDPSKMEKPKVGIIV